MRKRFGKIIVWFHSWVHRLKRVNSKGRFSTEVNVITAAMELQILQFCWCEAFLISILLLHKFADPSSPFWVIQIIVIKGQSLSDRNPGIWTQSPVGIIKLENTKGTFTVLLTFICWRVFQHNQQYVSQKARLLPTFITGTILLNGSNVFLP